MTLITTPSGAEAQPLVQDLPVTIMASPTSEEPGSTTAAGDEAGDPAAATGTQTTAADTSTSFSQDAKSTVADIIRCVDDVTVVLQ